MLAYRHLAGLGAVWQLAAEESTALAAGFSDLAAQLGAQDAGDPVAQVHAVLAVRPGNWLLIFDDAPGPAALQGVLPPAGRGQVLITSQNSHWPGRQAVDVPVLDEDVAAAFLLTRTGSADRDGARQLAAELGGLPLALEQAAAFMLAAGRTMSDYLALFRQRRADLLARGQSRCESSPWSVGRRRAWYRYTGWSRPFPLPSCPKIRLRPGGRPPRS